ncbi:MAG: nucleotidyltransferase family protein [Vicingaceae bacterium]
MKLSKRIAEISIDKDDTLLNAVKRMDEVKTKLLLITEFGNYFSLLSIGDIQRAIIQNKDLSIPIHKILRDPSKITVAKSNMTEEAIRDFVFKARAEFMPIVDDYGNLVTVYFWEEHFNTDIPNAQELKDVPVVIMAGGRGSRLKPITNIIPKAMLPLEEKTILEHIKDRFVSFGVDEFYFMLNYKRNMITNYFDDLACDEKIHYIIENKPLGTAGSLSLLRGEIESTFFVSNCDIVVNADYNEIYKYHQEKACEITLVSALKHYSIPYGTLEISEEGILKKIEEKPELTFLVNSGMYILEPHLLDEVPSDTFYHITSLIEKVMARKGQVGVFPISEKSWMDIGEWDEYNRTQKMYKDYFNKGL